MAIMAIHLYDLEANTLFCVVYEDLFLIINDSSFKFFQVVNLI